MKVLLLSVLSVLSYSDISRIQGASGQINSVEDYYWRDHRGLIPNNAIPGGVDENGATTYIAQFTTIAEYNLNVARLHTIPAVIKLGAKHAVGAYLGRALSSNDTTNTKILCYGYSASRYTWRSPTSIFPPNCRFVIAGYEDAVPMYVGRASHNKETVVGKIFSDTTRHRPGLISPYNGGEVYHSVYQILTYCT